MYNDKYFRNIKKDIRRKFGIDRVSKKMLAEYILLNKVNGYNKKSNVRIAFWKKIVNSFTNKSKKQIKNFDCNKVELIKKHLSKR